jgi:hypothetical protein
MIDIGESLISAAIYCLTWQIVMPCWHWLVGKVRRAAKAVIEKWRSHE